MLKKALLSCVFLVQKNIVLFDFEIDTYYKISYAHLFFKLIIELCSFDFIKLKYELGRNKEGL